MTRSVIVTAGLLFAVSLFAQTPAAPPTPAAAPSPQAPAPPGKNIKVLTSLSQSELITTMHMMRASLGVRCEYCHEQTANGINFESEGNEHKDAAREMIELTRTINEQTFEGRPVVSCYTCHQGSPHPASLVPLPQSIPAPPPAATAATDAQPAPVVTSETIIASYLKATKPRSGARTLRGTTTSGRGAGPIEVVQTSDGTTITTTTAQGETRQFFGANGGWVTDQRGRREFKAADAEHLREPYAGLDLPLLEPKSTGWSKPRKDKVGDVEAWMISRRPTPSTTERFWFDPNSGLLLRTVRTESSIVGRVPMQIDYADWRDVDGSKVPFSVKTSLVDVRSSGEIKLESVEYADAKKPSKN